MGKYLVEGQVAKGGGGRKAEGGGRGAWQRLETRVIRLKSRPAVCQLCGSCMYVLVCVCVLFICVRVLCVC